MKPQLDGRRKRCQHSPLRGETRVTEKKPEVTTPDMDLIVAASKLVACCRKQRKFIGGCNMECETCFQAEMLSNIKKVTICKNTDEIVESIKMNLSRIRDEQSEYKASLERCQEVSDKTLRTRFTV